MRTALPSMALLAALASVPLAAPMDDDGSPTCKAVAAQAVCYEVGDEDACLDAVGPGATTCVGPEGVCIDRYDGDGYYSSHCMGRPPATTLGPACAMEEAGWPGGEDHGLDCY